MEIRRSYGIGRALANIMRLSGTLSTEDYTKVEPIAKTGLKQSRLHQKTLLPPSTGSKSKGKNVNIVA